ALCARGVPERHARVRRDAERRRDRRRAGLYQEHLAARDPRAASADQRPGGTAMTGLKRLLLPGVVSLIIAAAAPSSAHSLKELEDQLTASDPYIQVVNRPAPAFALQDADGHVTSLADLHGKVVILYFIYASCPDVCPLLSEKIADIQEQINA